MKRTIRGLLAALVLFAAAPALAQEVGGEEELLQELFQPELVMAHQGRISLAPEQRTTITTAIKELQGDVVDLEWSMIDQQQRLMGLLAMNSVDQSAALARAEELLTTEQRIKMAHLKLLITIKNALTTRQQAALREIRDERGEQPQEQ